MKELLDQFILEDYRYDAKRRYHRAFYSYDALDGIENDILMFGPSPCELYEQKERHAALYAALLKLPEKQLRRIYLTVRCRFRSCAKKNGKNLSKSVDKEAGVWYYT